MESQNASSDRSARLLEQMRVINRVSAALNLSLAREEIYLLMLSALVSRQGLGYSRAIVLTFSDTTACFEGRLALGPITREESDAFDREVRAEEEALEGMTRRLEAQPGEEEGLSIEEAPLDDSPMSDALSDLKAATVWVTTFQSSAADSALTKRARAIRWPYVEGDPARSGLLFSLAEGRQAIQRDKAPGAGELPEALHEILDDVFVAVPIITRKGLRAVVLADRKFAAKPVDKGDMRLLEWFRNQSSLALENAELFGSLTDALNGLQELERLKSGFLSIISHELRTPLTAMLGFCELMLNGAAGPVSPRQAELLRRAINRGGLLNDMINDLLEVEEIEAGGLMDLEIEAVDPLAALIRALSKVETRRAEKNITIKPDMPEGPPGAVRSNPRVLERVLYHLLDNAVKFSAPSGQVDVGFRSEKERLAIAVTDRGIGIAPEEMRRIFDPFYQVDQRLTRRHQGIGIGLTVSRKLLEVVGGRIGVESEPGKGSAFTVSFPLYHGAPMG